MFQIDKPEVGEWNVKLKGNDDAYFIMTRVETADKIRVNADKKMLRKGEISKIFVNFGENFKGSVKRANISKSILDKNIAPMVQSLREILVDGNLNMSFTAPTELGVYNLSFDVEGMNGKGEKVNRSINYNFAVTDDEGNIK